MEAYKFLGDEEEFKWFFNNVIIPPEKHEEYCFCSAARAKKLSEEEKEKFMLGRAEMLEPHNIYYSNFSYESFKRAILKYEVNKEAMVTKSGIPYPDKTLVCYIYVNPSSDIKVMQAIKEQISNLDNEIVNSSLKGSPKGVSETIDKVSRFLHKIKRLYPANLSQKHYLDFDMDLEDVSQEEKETKVFPFIENIFLNQFGKKNFFIVSTCGGFHILVKKEAFAKVNNGKGFNPKVWAKNIESNSYPFKIKEFIFNVNECIPCPGTYQYEKVVKILNKEDFLD